MKVNPIAALGFLALGTLTVFLILSALQRDPESISISILDGSDLSGAEILNAAYSLSGEHSVEIRFRSSERELDSITAMSRKTISDYAGDWMSLELRPNEILMNEEVLSEDQLRSRLLSFAESARLTDSVPIILVAARNETTGLRFVDVLQILCDTGISHIIPTYTTEAANKASILTPDTPRVENLMTVQTITQESELALVQA